MDSGPSKDGTGGEPAPEVLTERQETTGSADTLSETKIAISSEVAKKQRRSYRPSHRATFIGLGVVVAILAVNAVVILLVLRAQPSSNANAPSGQVTISQDVLNRVGVNQDTVGDSGVVLTITPNTQFKGNVTVGSDITIGGKFNLNGQFTAANASLTQLQAGITTLNSVKVSGDTTVNTVTVQKQLSSTGTTLLQGPVTVSQLLTVNNSANVAGNLSVGGSVSAGSITARSLTTTSTLTISGHVITAGSAPSLSGGVGLGSNGTLSLSGNDAAGTIAINVGAGGMSSGGIVANVTFRNAYSTTPHVVVTPIGNINTNFYITRSSSGFSIGLSSPISSPGGYAFDYIVEQ